jgi:hypothetical protein
MSAMPLMAAQIHRGGPSWARTGHYRAPRRRATGVRIDDFAGALDKSLRQRSQRAVLDCDERGAGGDKVLAG